LAAATIRNSLFFKVCKNKEIFLSPREELFNEKHQQESIDKY
jgi:hypothetical protein